MIESEAYKTVQEVRGAADAKATNVYAAGYSTTPEARELYAFLKTMDTYKKVIAESDQLVLSTDSELFRFLSDPSGERTRR